MLTMIPGPPSLRLAALSIGTISPAAHPHPSGDGTALAQASASTFNQGTVELEDYLFVQDPHLPGGKKDISVYWIPRPIQKYCLGKTTEQCVSLDYCLRTTNTNDSRCRNLHAEMARLRPYPRDMRPRRVLSVVYFQLAPVKGFDQVQKFYQSAPRASLDRLSSSARIKARIKLTRTADDDDFDVIEVLAIPPF